MSVSTPCPPQPTSSETARSNHLMRSLSRYRHPSLAVSLWQLGSTLVGFIACWIAMWYALQFSYWITLLISPLTAAFMVRLFIIQHDCGHRSFFRSRTTNDRFGVWLGILTMTPYHCWRKEHASHHATSGDLSRRHRGGEIHTLTVREYQSLSRWQRLKYRLYRNPLILFVIGPAIHFAIRQRLTFDLPKTWKKERASVHLTNLGLLLTIAAVIWLVGWRAFLMVELPVLVLASSMGVWLFYVQHQYEDTYWRWRPEWDYTDAALQGSSYYRLPRVLQWFTANIGLHHIHHLDSKIPNYRLQQCVNERPDLKAGTTITLVESLPCMGYKLWDEEASRMVGYPR